MPPTAAPSQWWPTAVRSLVLCDRHFILKKISPTRWLTSENHMFRAQYQRQQRRLAGLCALVALLAVNATATAAQCTAEPLSATQVSSNHASGGHSGLLGTLNLSSIATAESACQKEHIAQAGDLHRSSLSSATGFLLAAGNARMSSDYRGQMDSRFEATAPSESRVAMAEAASPIAKQLDVHWQNNAVPLVVQSVPEWVTSTAKNYHRKGLPVVHLWESSNSLIALGLSNHGVPGLYFSQKLP